MQIKHFLGLMLIWGVIGVIAYNVGANTNYLSSTQTTFTDLVSTNHHKQLKAPMRDAMINKLSHWAKNHEMRLQNYAQSTNYPHLTDDQLAFGSYLSTKNNNMLTAPMRDGLMGDFTNVITNHEMRIRCIQDGSCLKAQSTESPIGSGEAVLVVTNPLDMIFGADQRGSSYARALKVKGINIRLQEDDPRLRYYSKNPNIIQPYGYDTVAEFVPLTGGTTQVCAYLMENGKRIEGCTVAVVGNGSGGSNGGSCTGRAVLKLKATAKKIPVSAINCYYWQSNGQIIGGGPHHCPGSLSTINRNNNTIEYSKNYPTRERPDDWQHGSGYNAFRQRWFYHRGTFSRVDPDRTGKSPFCETTVQGSKIIVHIDKCKYKCYDIDFTRWEYANSENYNTSHCEYVEECTVA